MAIEGNEVRVNKWMLAGSLLIVLLLGLFIGKVWAVQTAGDIQTYQVTTSSSVSDQEAEYRARKVDVPLPGGAKVQVTAGELSDAFKGIKEGIESGKAQKELEQRFAPLVAGMSDMVAGSHIRRVLIALHNREKTLPQEQLAHYDRLKELANESSAMGRQRMHSYIPRGSKRDLAMKKRQKELLQAMSMELFRLAEMGERLSVLGTDPIYAQAREKSKS